LRVLVVDDNRTNRKILVHQTASWGMIPVEAESGAIALELLRSSIESGEPYDVALLDMMMPGMDGFELARAIKTDPQLSNVKLVLMPSFGQRGDGQAAREIGIAAYLMKPVRQSQLFDCLATVMGEGETAALTTEQASSRLVTRHSLEENKFAAAATRILIAEDNPVNQKVSKRQVENLGYRADVVENGIEALDALSKIPYDIVLMDCQMPHMDGYEATAEIRRREEGTGNRTVIIAMTANALEGESEKCLAAGMNDYISKPVDVSELQKILKLWQPKSSGEGDDAEAGATKTDRLLPTLQDKPAAAPVDIKRLLEAASDDEELARELIEMYLKQMSEIIEKIDAAFLSQRADEINRLAHTAAGSSATIGAAALAAQLKELEQLSVSDEAENAVQLMTRIKTEITRVESFFKDLPSVAIKV
jgi:CheY-like chemotaxis protein/HPt (histidine-containing phosphotransfer) domain-containing protein